MPGVVLKAGHANSSKHLMPSLINISSCTYDKHKEGAMWRVDDCFFMDVSSFYYWMCGSDVSVISLRMCLLSTIVIGPVVLDFLSFLACGG